MAIDDVPFQGDLTRLPSERPDMNVRTKVILIVLAVSLVAQIYSITRIVAMGNAFQAQDARMRKELTAQFNDQLSSRLQSLEQANSEQLEALKAELDKDSRHLGAQQGALSRARQMVSKLQAEHVRQMNDLQHQIAMKADQQQLGALTEDVSDTRTDLGRTKKSVDELVSSLGMTRTRFGTLIARNHDEIMVLRQLGQRDYFEFTVRHHHPVRVAGVGLDLKRTNKKHHRFSLDMLVDDVWIEKKHRTLNEPIFFTTRGSRSFDELVVNKVDKGVISGYISTPKGAARMASRLEGTR